MIVGYSSEGKSLDISKLQEMGIDVRERDYRRKYKVDKNTGGESDEYEYVLNFSGFLMNDKSDLYTVFPINYKVKNLSDDSKILFNVISSHFQKRPEIYFGEEYGNKYESNYPFAAFFGVYDYYKEYGLYFEDKKLTKPNINGKINWKETIRLSDKYVINDELFFHPIYYEKSYYNTVFLTKAMIFVINYTIDKFNFIIGLEKVKRPYSEQEFLSNKTKVLENLYNIRQETFKDISINLIDHLINFFFNINKGGAYYFKHYSFSSVWEDMVKHYLSLHFKKVRNNILVLGERNKSVIEFKKRVFRPNLANKKQYISPDYYYTYNNNQFIFDAKYYTEISSMDYKQIAYFFFLKDYKSHILQPRKYALTHSALILPGVERESKIHFQMDPQYNSDNIDIVISEEYLDIREVMMCYLDS